MSSKSKLIIPEKLKVGFNNRNSTYTGKLGFVTYIDSKGVHRSQVSFDNWRDKNIDILDIDNEPTAGFVLNKKVGGDRWGWNPRKTYTRVFDPRGFEFEIDIPNLLFILDECDSIKGKGLEGEFVYSWDGKNLVLLPISSQEYKDSLNFTSLQSQKITKKDMLEGCLYLNKNNDKMIYLGRYLILEYRYSSLEAEAKKMHCFITLDGKENSEKPNYWFQKGFTKLAQKLDDKPSSDFANFDEAFEQSKYREKVSAIKLLPMSWDKYYQRYYEYKVYKHTDGTMHIFQIGYYNEYKRQIEIDGLGFKTISRVKPSWFPVDTRNYSEKPKLSGKLFNAIYINKFGNKITNCNLY